jgi:hypothetical protein
MKSRQFKLSAISVIFGLAFDSVATFAGQVHEIEAAKAIGATKCGECHKHEEEAWKLTRHFKTFDSMYGSAEAQQICAGLGVKRIRSESLGLPYHYTVPTKAGTSEPIAAVSCEIVPWRRSRLEQCT